MMTREEYLEEAKAVVGAPLVEREKSIFFIINAVALELFIQVDVTSKIAKETRRVLKAVKEGGTLFWKE